MFEHALIAVEGATVAEIRKIAQLTCFLMAENIIVGGTYGNATGTPVDTGYARAQWTPSLHEPVKRVSAPDQSGQRASDDVGTTVASLELGNEFWLTNGASYIRPLEAGYSRQAPLGMVAPVLLNAQPIVDLIVKARRAYAAEQV